MINVGQISTEFPNKIRNVPHFQAAERDRAETS